MDESLEKNWNAESLFKYARKNFSRLERRAGEKSKLCKVGSDEWQYCMDLEDTYDHLGQIVNILEIVVNNNVETQKQVEKLTTMISQINGTSKEIKRELTILHNQIGASRGSLIQKLKKILSKYELASFEVGAPGVFRGHFRRKDNQNNK